MHSNKKLLELLTGVALFAATNVCLGMAQVFAAPPAVTGDPKLGSPPASFMDDPLLKSDALYPFRDAYGYSQNGYPKAHAVLALSQTCIRQTRQDEATGNEYFTVDIRLYNDGGDAINCYNLYWDPLIPTPGRLALYDSQKRYACDLMESMGGSRKSIAARDWAEVPAFCYLGRLLGTSLPYPSYKVIPPGKYYLQVIYLPRLLLFPSESNSSAFNYDEHTELFRSNAVPITVVDQSAVKTPKSAVPSKS